jgi:dissimilatory sulfite reductase (desulfoviridin) alpha/beta subunit|tara:strand:- start:25 stop:366 length:342 start_codon:yes stop_codon:yes gene_type:complete
VAYNYYPKDRHPPKKKETTKEKTIRILKKTAGKFSGGRAGKTRREQFAIYMNHIDKLQNAKADLRGRVELGPLTAKAGKAGSARVTRMTDILDKYHDKALRMAQAKYYQKQLG